MKWWRLQKEGSMSWKSNYKLSISFIIFFVLFFFLLGEQLPALPLYIGAPHGNSDKVHILDLAPGDALHRPIAYLIIAVINWLVFRTFAWPIAFALGDLIAIVDQFFFIPEPASPTLSSALKISIAWVVFTLVPYFLFRWIEKKWAGKGIRNAILILFSINLLLFGFFAFQIFYLHHSFRGLHKNTQGQVDSTPRLPPKTCPERLTEEKDKPTTAYWNGKTLEVAAEEQKWVEQNCPGVLQRP